MGIVDGEKKMVKHVTIHSADPPTRQRMRRDPTPAPPSMRRRLEQIRGGSTSTRPSPAAVGRLMKQRQAQRIEERTRHYQAEFYSYFWNRMTFFHHAVRGDDFDLWFTGRQPGWEEDEDDPNIILGLIYAIEVDPHSRRIRYNYVMDPDNPDRRLLRVSELDTRLNEYAKGLAKRIEVGIKQNYSDDALDQGFRRYLSQAVAQLDRDYNGNWKSLP